MDRKPILVIYLERQDLMQGISPQMQRLKDEYHIIILPGKENKAELLSSEKIEPIDIEELKQSLRFEGFKEQPKPREEKPTTSILAR